MNYGGFNKKSLWSGDGHTCPGVVFVSIAVKFNVGR